MSLVFAANGDLISFGSQTHPNDGAGTICFWIYPTDNTARQQLFIWINGFGLGWRADSSGNFEFFVNRVTTPLLIEFNYTNAAAFGTNKWVFMAFRWNASGVAGDEEAYIGDLSTLAVEPSSYFTQQVGSGNVGGTGTYVLGNHSSATTRYFRGRIAHYSKFDRYLNIDEIHHIQFSRKPIDNCKHFIEPGFNGTGTQPDWSGNGFSGTVTGATVTDHVPLAPLFGYDASLPYAVVVANDRRSKVTFTEFEIPDAPRRSKITFTELEVPNAPRKGIISFTEFEVPDAARRSKTTFTEFEIPTAPRKAIISFTEFEVPTTGRNSIISFAEFEVPNASRRSKISFAEFEIPDGARKAIISFLEFEIPNAARRSRISQVEFEIPNAPRKAIVSFAELQVPDLGAVQRQPLIDITTITDLTSLT